MINVNEAKMVSGFGQYHTNEADPQKPNKKLTPYLGINWSDVKDLVDTPQQVDKADAQWLIPSSLHSRIAISQKHNGQYYLLWVDLDQNPPPLPKLSQILEGFIGDADYEIYNTRSATEGNQKSRVLIPLAESLSCFDWVLAQQILNDKFEELGITPDRANEKPAQLCYLPNKGEFYSAVSKRNGEPL